MNCDSPLMSVLNELYSDNSAPQHQANLEPHNSMDLNPNYRYDITDKHVLTITAGHFRLGELAHRFSNLTTILRFTKFAQIFRFSAHLFDCFAQNHVLVL